MTEEQFPKVAVATAPEKKKRRGAASEYKKSLIEKQTLKRLYGLSEKQFKKYVKETLELRTFENMPDELIKRLERRLDNAVFRMGFSKSRAHARQMVSHAYFFVNGRSVNISSFNVKKGDVVSLKETKKNKPILKDLAEIIKKTQAPPWLEVDSKKLEGKVVSEPNLAQANPPVEIQLIFEFYSR